jgi:hypothetical protein
MKTATRLIRPMASLAVGRHERCNCLPIQWNMYWALRYAVVQYRGADSVLVCCWLVVVGLLVLVLVLVCECSCYGVSSVESDGRIIIMSGKFLQSTVARGLREAGAALKQKGGVEVSKRLPNWMMLMMLLVACVFLLEFFVVVVVVVM